MQESNNHPRWKHGMSKTRLHNIWWGMLERCNNSSTKTYQRYGAVGVSVCDEWLEFIVFMKWSKDNGYNDILTIDRIDTTGNYEPTNCRWVTHKEQSMNRRPSREWKYNKTNSNNTSGVKGVTFDKSRGKWIAQISFKETGHKQKRFKTKEEAVAQRKEWEQLI